jgi:hypothetical protein
MGETGQNVMNVTAIVFAYVLTAYFAGSQLPRIWAIGISLCYTLFVTPVFIGCITGIGVTISLVNAYISNFPGGTLIDNYALIRQSPDLVASLVLIPIVAGWLGSILYMHMYIRKQGSA